jgi:hypothetical protein
MQMSKTDMNLALGIFGAAAVLAGPITAAIATATFVAGLLLS